MKDEINMLSQPKGEDISVLILPSSILPLPSYHFLNFTRLSIFSFSSMATTKSFLLYP